MINPYHSVCVLNEQVWIVASLPFKTSAGCNRCSELEGVKTERRVILFLKILVLMLSQRV